MTNQPGFPVTPAAGVAAAAIGSSDESDRPDAGSATDGGVPVGEADVRADEQRARGAGDDNDDDNGLMPDLLRGDREDDGVPVGRADAEEDRRRAQEGN